ncbi:hypothetical protein BD311DRAFT_804178 [Dichomitus squalens]|uniref:DUF1640-domain-containing protein n=1 Tax=Dichomitus squalens TaxID=114155 RepID=A0A4V2K1B6_9APHY|nr:hypothetical protein BD311DRAFT_804178 [Dichomitus squalens]
MVSYVTIWDPRNPQGSQSISLAHPKDPTNLGQPGPSQSALPPPISQAPTPELPASDGANRQGEGAGTTPPPDEDASLPVKYVHSTIDPQTNLPLPHAGPASPPLHINPPFDTHRFYKVLEQSFPGPIALNLMRATRALLVDRIGRVKRDALTTQDLESQAYLFQAALSELRSETSVLTRNETAAMRAATTAVRREVDTIDTRMKEDLATLKHEIQMDLDNRKSEARNDLKRVDIQVEEVLSRALITISELKTQVEESRWEKLKAAVGALAVLSFVIIISVEIYVVGPSRAAKRRAEQPPPPPVLPPLTPNEGTQIWTGTT